MERNRGTIVPKIIDIPYDGRDEFGLYSGLIMGSSSSRGKLNLDNARRADGSHNFNLESIEGDTSMHFCLSKAAGVIDPFMIEVTQDRIIQMVAMQYSIGKRKRFAQCLVIFGRNETSINQLHTIKTLLGSTFRNFCRTNYPSFEVDVVAFRDSNSREL